MFYNDMGWLHVPGVILSKQKYISVNTDDYLDNYLPKTWQLDLNVPNFTVSLLNCVRGVIPILQVIVKWKENIKLDFSLFIF